MTSESSGSSPSNLLFCASTNNAAPVLMKDDAQVIQDQLIVHFRDLPPVTHNHLSQDNVHPACTPSPLESQLDHPADQARYLIPTIDSMYDGVNSSSEGFNSFQAHLIQAFAEIVKTIAASEPPGTCLHDPSKICRSLALRIDERYRTTMRALLDIPPCQDSDTISFSSIHWPVFGTPLNISDLSYSAIVHFIGYFCVMKFRKRGDDEDVEHYNRDFKRVVANRAADELMRWLPEEFGWKVIDRIQDLEGRELARRWQDEVTKQLMRIAIEFSQDRACGYRVDYHAYCQELSQN